MKRFVILSIFSATLLGVHAQYITFHSAEFETGVKKHIGLSSEDSVLTAQADTITSINLSELGIKDIRDVAWLGHVKKLDLSKNWISDIEPLLLVDSLREVNLRDNDIDDIAPLIYSRSDSIFLNISNNHIDNFSMFFRPTHCVFTFFGMAQQTAKNTSYLSVYSLYSDISAKGTAWIAYRGFTNTDGEGYLECGTMRHRAILDGTFQRISVTDTPQTISQVFLTNDEDGDSTYIVPATFHQVGAGETIEINTELPDNYQICYVNCLHGTASVIDNRLQYTAKENLVADTLYFAFYEGSKLRGFSQYYLAKDLTAIKSVKDETDKSLLLNGNQLSIRWNSSELADQSTITIFAPSGLQLASKQVDSSNGIDTIISIIGSRSSVLIVQVVSGKKKWIEKVLAK